MKKARSAFVLFLALALICTTHLNSIEVSGTSIKDTKYYVQFNSNGGSYCPTIYNVPYGTTIELPVNPSRYNYWFRGWYCDQSFTIKFDTTTKVYSNMVVYAKWEQKSSTPNILSQTIKDGNVQTTVTCDIKNQTYGSGCKMNLLVYDHYQLDALVNSISKTDKYIGFELNIDDLAFNTNNPIPTQIKIPSNFSASNTAVFYSTNRQTISGEPVSYINKAGELAFDAYYSGTYILIECIDQKGDKVDPNAHVKIIGKDSIKLNQQDAYTYRFVNYSGDESQYDFTWYSSFPHIASVDKDGVVTANAPGKTTISCVSQNSKFVARKVITVPGIMVKSISTNAGTKRMAAKSTFQLKYMAKPINATNKKLKFHSTNVKVATVSSTGKIVANKKGTCYIKISATDGSKVVKKVKIIVK